VTVHRRGCPKAALEARFREYACREHLVGLQWPEVFGCVRCGGSKACALPVCHNGNHLSGHAHAVADVVSRHVVDHQSKERYQHAAIEASAGAGELPDGLGLFAAVARYGSARPGATLGHRRGRRSLARRAGDRFACPTGRKKAKGLGGFGCDLDPLHERQERARCRFVAPSSTFGVHAQAMAIGHPSAGRAPRASRSLRGEVHVSLQKVQGRKPSQTVLLPRPASRTLTTTLACLSEMDS
jgi:hypothetical protein